jgi:phosphoadenosine phosphosulfate reductase
MTASSVIAIGQPAAAKRPAPDAALQAAVAEKSALVMARLNTIIARHPNVVFANSLGAEDMVLMDMIAGDNLPIGIFTLDTGRLNEETYALLAEVQKRYEREIQIMTPDYTALEPWVREHGINGFYDSVENRKACCQIRKLEPLARALKGKDAWITGLRAAQSVTRQNMDWEDFDTLNNLPKFNPLIEWSEKEIWAYIDLHHVPYNQLHDRFYPSIGCAPCTRAITPGEDVRAGRWWWENPETKECGLHKAK